MTKFRIFVNNQRVATCVVLKDKSFYQVFPIKKYFATKGSWVGEWADQFDSLNIIAEYPEEESDTDSETDSTSITEEEEYETEEDETDDDDDDTDDETESEEEMEEWRPNSYKTNNTAYDWLMESMWAKGIRVQVPVADHC